ncbi:hypothetical protein ABZ468_35320 [Streptomyces sp. NPDC005708]|uniref:hypothetical protein n=1 Tax=Streptomyces sp. NPDC005708 TaxID=3154564 RepID=UPI00340FE697
MSTSIAAPAPAAATPAAATVGGRVRHPQIPAQAGNAPVRQALAAGVHPASRLPLLNPDTPTGCGGCVLAYVLPLAARDGQAAPTSRLKCSKAPVSRRGRQGVDLRPDTPACTSYTTAEGGESSGAATA